MSAISHSNQVVAPVVADDSNFFSPPVSRSEVQEVFQTWRNPSSIGQSSDDSGLGLNSTVSQVSSHISMLISLRV